MDQIRKDRKPQGRKRLTAERAAYFQLMREGYNNTEACRIVGINRRTGKVWRNGRNANKGRLQRTQSSTLITTPPGLTQRARPLEGVNFQASIPVH
ncbi:hypothetical protein ACWFR4_48560, partial [Streptomyces sp. NPDC055140]